MFKQVKLNDAILKFYQRSQPVAFSNAETLYDDLVLLRDQILMYGDLSEAQTNYLNNFIEKFDTTLNTTVRDIFEKWLNDGFLVDFIRDVINEEVIESRDGEAKLNLRLIRDNQDIETKINLLKEKDNQLTTQMDQKAEYTTVWGMTNLSQEVKESMTGGSVAVVGENSVSRVNIVGDAVTTLNADFIQTPNSLINPSTFTDNFYVSNAVSTGGEVFPSEHNAVTDFSYIKGGVVYSIFPLPTDATIQPINIAFYGPSRTSYLGGKNFNYQSLIDNDFTIIPPAGTVFYRVSCDKSVKDKINLVFGSEQQPNARYNTPKLKRNEVDLNMRENEVLPENTSFIEASKNKFNYQNAEDGKYISTLSGNIVANERNFLSELTRVKENQLYTISPIPKTTQQPFNIVFKDYTGKRLGGYQVKEGNSQTIQTPPNTYYIHFSGDLTLKDKTQLEEGSTATFFTNHTLKFKGVVENPILNHQYLYLGDSMGANNSITSKLESLLGTNVINGAFGSTTISGHKDTNLNALSFKEIATALATNNFNTQETAVTALGVPYHTDHLNNLKNVDMNQITDVILFSGTNNYGGDRTPIDDMTQGYSDGLNTLLSVYPHLQFYVITPIYRGDKTGVNEIGLTLKQYVDAIVNVTGEYGFNALDGLLKMGINNKNIGYWLKSDLIHPNGNGEELISEKIYRFITSN